MRAWRIPDGLWSWRASGAVLLVLLAPLLLTLQLAPEADRDTLSAALAATLVYAAAAIAAVLVYLCWRLSWVRAEAFVSMGLAIAAVHGLAGAGLQALSVERVDRNSGWFLLFDLVAGLALVTLGPLSQLGIPRVNPLLVGIMAGAAIGVGRQVTVTTAPQLAWGSESDTGAEVLVAASGLALALVLGRATSLEPWVRIRLALAVILLAGSSLVDLAPQGATGTDLAMQFLAVGIATLLLSTTLALMRQTITVEEQATGVAEERLAEAEARTRLDQARLHEIDATVAGIASASDLLYAAAGDGLDDERRAVLEEMMQAEFARLRRLIATRSSEPPSDVPLDEIISNLVASHRAQGRTVHFTPTSHHATGRRDDIAEIVNILLENAARHGSPDRIVIAVRRAEPYDADDAVIEILVSDQGPGVRHADRDRIFEWGHRRPDSPGQGIGLHLAQALSLELGGTLTLGEPSGEGATFVVRLAAATDLDPHQPSVPSGGAE